MDFVALWENRAQRIKNESYPFVDFVPLWENMTQRIQNESHPFVDFVSLWENKTDSLLLFLIASQNVWVEKAGELALRNIIFNTWGENGSNIQITGSDLKFNLHVMVSL